MLLCEHRSKLTEEQRSSYELPLCERQHQTESFERGFQAQPFIFLLIMLGRDSGSADVQGSEQEGSSAKDAAGRSGDADARQGHAAELLRGGYLGSVLVLM